MSWKGFWHTVGKTITTNPKKYIPSPKKVGILISNAKSSWVAGWSSKYKSRFKKEGEELLDNTAEEAAGLAEED